MIKGKELIRTYFSSPLRAYIKNLKSQYLSMGKVLAFSYILTHHQNIGKIIFDFTSNMIIKTIIILERK